MHAICLFVSLFKSIAGHKGGFCLKWIGQQEINEIEVETVDDSEMEDVSELPNLSSSYNKRTKNSNSKSRRGATEGSKRQHRCGTCR